MPIRSAFRDDESFADAFRDWLAAQALAGVGTWAPNLAGATWSKVDLAAADSLQARAEWAYAQADAMLAAKSAGGTAPFIARNRGPLGISKHG